MNFRSAGARIGLIVAVAGATAVGAVAVGVTHAGSAGCSIAGMANEYGLDLADGPEAATIPVADVSQSALEEFAGATVAEQQLARIRSTQLPAVDGHLAWILRLTSVPDAPAGGPAGESHGMLRSVCTVAIYDATNGSFLANLRDLSAE